MAETESSSPICPRSTHCRAAIVVMSLVQEARINVAFRSMGSVRVLGPKAFSYLNVPRGRNQLNHLISGVGGVTFGIAS